MTHDCISTSSRTTALLRPALNVKTRPRKSHQNSKRLRDPCPIFLLLLSLLLLCSCLSLPAQVGSQVCTRMLMYFASPLPSFCAASLACLLVYESGRPSPLGLSWWRLRFLPTIAGFSGRGTC